MLLTNKHFIAALIIAPILAIIAFFATDYVVSEKPHEAVSGQNYPLAAKSNCRYASGRCDFKNGDVEISLIATSSGDNVKLQLESELPLVGAKLALANSAGQSEPQIMDTVNDDNRLWQMNFYHHDLENARLLLVVAIDDTIYYGDTETTFIQ